MNIRQEEYLPLAKDLFQSFSRDLSDFTAEDHNYTPQYKDLFWAKIQEVETKEQQDSTLVQQKKVTQELYLAGDNLRLPLKKLNLRIQRSGIPTTLVSDIIKNIRRRNFEGVSDQLTKLIQVVSENSVALQAKGMKGSLPAELQVAQTAIAAKADEQTQMMKKVSGTINTNNQLYKELYAFVTNICEDGKLIYEGTQKVEEYTLRKMLNRMHKSIENTDKVQEEKN